MALGVHELSDNALIPPDRFKSSHQILVCIWSISRSQKIWLVTRMHFRLRVVFQQGVSLDVIGFRFPIAFNSQLLAFVCTWWTRCFRTGQDLVSSVVEQGQDTTMNLVSEVLNVRHVGEGLHAHARAFLG